MNDATHPSPRGRPKDDDLAARRREEILRAAAQAFAQHGYRVTEMQHIADLAGVSKGTLYLYFKNKEQLFLATVEHGVQELFRVMHEALDPIPTFVERLPVAIQTYLRYFDENPGLVELIMQERAEFRDRRQSTYFELGAAKACQFQEIVEADVAAGRLRPIVAERLRNVIGDMLYGAIFANHFRGRIVSLEDQAQDITQVLMRGVLGGEGEPGLRGV